MKIGPLTKCCHFALGGPVVMTHRVEVRWVIILPQTLLPLLSGCTTRFLHRLRSMATRSLSRCHSKLYSVRGFRPEKSSANSSAFYQSASCCWSSGSQFMAKPARLISAVRNMCPSASSHYYLCSFCNFFIGDVILRASRHSDDDETRWHGYKLWSIVNFPLANRSVL